MTGKQHQLVAQAPLVSIEQSHQTQDQGEGGGEGAAKPS